jgi:hypothetical protein
MALLGRTVAVDLKKTPILCWQWRIDAPVASADMNKKSGDDYAARVYLTFTVPPEQLGFATRTKLSLARSIYGNQVPDAAINYVWDNKQPVGTLQRQCLHRPRPHAGAALRRQAKPAAGCRNGAM